MNIVSIRFGEPLPGRRAVDTIRFIHIRQFPDCQLQFSPAFLGRIQSAIAILGQKKVAGFMEKAISKVPDDPWGAARYFMGCCQKHLAQTKVANQRNG